jgi:hypothetical protein
VGRERERVKKEALLEALGILLRHALPELGPQKYTYAVAVSMKEL